MNINKKQQIDSWLGYILIAFFLPITRSLGILLKRNHQLAPLPDSIVFLKLMGLGSLIISSDMILSVKKKYPKARIVLITDSNIGNGIQYFLPEVEIWRLDTSSLPKTLTRSILLLIKTWQLGRLWVCDLEVYSKLTTIYSLLTCARNRFGFILHPVQFRNYLNTHNIYYNVHKNLKDNYSLMGQSLGLSHTESIVAREFSKRHPGVNYNEIIFNNTCSTLSVYRKLPTPTLVETIKWIMQNTDYKVTLVGTPDDYNENECMLSLHDLAIYAPRLSNIAGKLTFEAYYSYIESNAIMMVSIDSAPLHMAKKLGLPTLSIWGPTNPEHYLKIEENEHKKHLSIYKNLQCSPCVHHTSKLPCGGNNVCMKEITPKEIIQKLNSLLYEIA